jgi:repressor of nif and glnA expression
MTYAMDFDLPLRRGSVVINAAIIEREAFKSKLDETMRVFEKGYAMGTLVSLVEPGERVGSVVVPPGHVGFCTVCSVTLNGVLLKHGIPTRSLFSGLLQLENGQATRFVELISYDGTSIDPLQLFIRGRMTDYLGAIRDGNGRIGAGFREIPEESYDIAVQLAKKLEAVGLGAFLKIGRPSRELLNVRCGKAAAASSSSGVSTRSRSSRNREFQSNITPWLDTWITRSCSTTRSSPAASRRPRHGDRDRAEGLG